MARNSAAMQQTDQRDSMLNLQGEFSPKDDGNTGIPTLVGIVAILKKISASSKIALKLGGQTMKKWISPRVREICVGLEINSYASARL
jgi:coenzyme PQQ precursor peptide PqqA